VIYSLKTVWLLTIFSILNILLLSCQFSSCVANNGGVCHQKNAPNVNIENVEVDINSSNKDRATSKHRLKN
jgi:hypothetical protein